VAELVTIDVDLIVTRRTPVVLAARNATIPVVMAGTADPPLVAPVEAGGLMAYDTDRVDRHRSDCTYLAGVEFELRSSRTERH
jgi:hypothetical protein